MQNIISHYFSDFAQEENAETYDDWINRMIRERRKRRNPHPPSVSHKQEKRHKTAGISEESKRIFEENLRKQHEEEQRQQKAAREADILNLKNLYEERCEELFANPRQMLSYRAIPWPYQPKEGIEQMEKFLFTGLVKGSEEYKKSLKKQRIRWHPDRFAQKVGQYLKKDDREKILDKVKEISQILNGLKD